MLKSSTSCNHIPVMLAHNTDSPAARKCGDIPRICATISLYISLRTLGLVDTTPEAQVPKDASAFAKVVPALLKYEVISLEYLRIGRQCRDCGAISRKKLNSALSSRTVMISVVQAEKWTCFLLRGDGVGGAQAR